MHERANFVEISNPNAVTMRRPFLCSFAFAALIALTGCTGRDAGGDEASQQEAQDALDASEMVGDLEAMLDANDTEGFRNVISQVQRMIESCLKEGLVDDAMDYAAKLKEFVDGNIDSIRGLAGGDDIVASIAKTINNIPGDISGKASEIESRVREDVDEVVGKVEDRLGKGRDRSRDSVSQDPTEAIRDELDDLRKRLDK